MTARPAGARVTLLRQARTLEQRLGIIVPIEAFGLGDEIDIVSHNTETVLSLTVREGLSTKLRKTREALERFDGGTYGDCLECGEAIKPPRLAVVPEAELCIRCQASIEERRSKSGSRWAEEEE